MTVIALLPPAPSRADPANFADVADVFVAALPAFGTQTNLVAGEINTSATTASTAATTATTQAGIATTQAGNAATSASTASTSASTASTQAGNASTFASTASTQAGIATTKAAEALSSANAAAASAASVGFNLTSTSTFTNKTINLSNNTVTGTTAQFNTALSDGDFATLAGTETLTNKTLTTPVLSNPSYSGTTANGGVVTTIDINGGTIDGTVIGGSSAAAGSFTTLSASGAVTFSRATGAASVGLVATTGTNEAYYGVSNSGGGYAFGVENSTGSWFGATPYAQVVQAATGRVIQHVIAGVPYTTTSSTGLSVNGTGVFTGTNPSITSAVTNTTGESSLLFADTALADAGFVAYDHSADRMRFGTVGTERMTLDASGNLLVGKTVTNFNTPGIEVRPAELWSTNPLGGAISLNTGLDGTLADFWRSGTQVGSIGVTTTTTTYNTTSDHRLKTNVRPANAARFMDIEFVDFEWTNGDHSCGVIAHQLQSVYPDLVLGEKDATETRTVEITPAVPAVLNEDGEEVTPAIPAVTEEQTFPVYQQVNYMGLIGRMGTRVQKLMEQVATLEADKATLLTVLASVDNRLMALEAA